MTTAPTALVTGASSGLGAALTTALVTDGWTVVTTARRPGPLRQAAAAHADAPGRLRPLPGDVADPTHRSALTELVQQLGGRLDLLVNNASTLGETPLPRLVDADLAGLRRVHEVNVLAPLALVAALLPALDAVGGTVLNVSSDAAVGHWPGWGP